MPVPIIGPSYDLATPKADVQRTVNMFPVMNEVIGGKTGAYFQQVPGLDVFSAAAPESELLVVKVQESETLLVGEDQTYTVVLTNFGPDDADGSTLVDDLPDAFTFLSCEIVYEGGAAGPATATEAELLAGIVITPWPSGGTATLTIFGTFNDVGEIVNTATVTLAGGSVGSGSTASVTTTVTPRVGLLDPYATNLWGCWGPDLLRGNYYGPVVRLYRPSDATEMDFGFVDDSAVYVDTAAIVAWIGASVGYVKTWYDQSGGSNDLATTPGTSIIQNADGELTFSGSALITVTNSGTPAAMTSFIDCVPNDVSGSNAFYSLSGSDNSSVVGGYLSYNNNTAKLNSRVQNVGDSNTRTFASMTQPARHVFGARWDRTQVTLVSQHHVMMDGVVQADTGSPGGVALATGSFTAQPWYLGGLISTSAMNMTCGLFAVWEAAISDAEMLLISATIQGR